MSKPLHATMVLSKFLVFRKSKTRCVPLGPTMGIRYFVRYRSFLQWFWFFVDTVGPYRGVANFFSLPLGPAVFLSFLDLVGSYHGVEDFPYHGVLLCCSQYFSIPLGPTVVLENVSVYDTVGYYRRGLEYISFQCTKKSTLLSSTMALKILLPVLKQQFDTAGSCRVVVFFWYP